MKTPKVKPTSEKCNICGSNLILLEVTSYTIGNNPSPVTKTTYRCSNAVCQEETDKKAAQRSEFKKEQERARERRRREAASIKLV